MAGMETSPRFEPFPGRLDTEMVTPGEVAAAFLVNPKTVVRWARAGKLSYIRTLGGHRRFSVGEVRMLLRTERGEP
jgi:excisionase family DNA binding protein